jgi:two-component system sensor histidine kinase/response regulator
VKQILINLIGNALKFTFQGSIVLTTGISYSSEGVPNLQITVRDTGIGIKPEDRDKIFQMLGKLEATASINTSGVGLGLSTCK